jgi:hypothetical protein
MPEPGANTGLAIQSKDAEAAAQWRNARYRRWQEEQQHAEPGLRPALLRLALASAAATPAGCGRADGIDRSRRDRRGRCRGGECAAVLRCAGRAQ